VAKYAEYYCYNILMFLFW